MPLPAPPTAGESSKPRQPPAPTLEDVHRQKILVCGWRKSGKSACVKTVFQSIPVKDVSYFGVTQKVERINYDSIINLQIWDTPATFELDQLDVPLGTFSTIIYVIDIQQDDTFRSAARIFVDIMARSWLANPSMRFAVFIHKAEALAEDYRNDNYGEVQRTMEEELLDYPWEQLQPLTTQFNLSDPITCSNIANHLVGEVRFSLTSVHNVTLRDAWSGVVQGVMEMLPSVEQLLLNFTANSGMDNSYLFDIESRVVVASDNRGKNESTLEQVTEYLARFMQFRELYKGLRFEKAPKPESELDTSAQNDGPVPNGDDEDGEEEYEGPRGWWDDEDPDAQWMTQSTRLMPNTTIALWQFTPHLILVVLVRTATWTKNRGMIEYNLTFLRQGVRRILMEM